MNFSETAETANRAEAKNLAQALAAAAHITFDEAWRRTRLARPELFGIQNRETAPAPDLPPAREMTLTESYHFGGAYQNRGLVSAGSRMVNRASLQPSGEARLDSARLADEIDTFAAKHGLSYTAATVKLRERHPGWFGVAVH